MQQAGEAIAALEAAFAAQRARLVRLCAQMTGSAEAAEDLAQETLIEAWRLAHRPDCASASRHAQCVSGSCFQHLSHERGADGPDWHDHRRRAGRSSWRGAGAEHPGRRLYPRGRPRVSAARWVSGDQSGPLRRRKNRHTVKDRRSGRVIIETLAVRPLFVLDA